MKPLLFAVGMLIAAGGLSQARGQDLPTSQPKYLTVYREQVKVGRADAHSKFEAGYPAALEKAKSPDYYLALASITGSSEVWYVQPGESYAAVGESMQREAKDPVLAAELSRLAFTDADYITSSKVIRARAKPELSIGAFPELAKARFFEISTLRIRAGREMEFEEIAKVYAGIAKRAANASFRVYEVVAGDRLPTYLIFSSVGSYAEIDKRVAEGEEAFKKATAEEMATLKKFGDVAETVESNEFRVDPAQSYVSKAVREKDPDFWMAK
ncbi:MAG: hypothetical protein U1G07_09000 [Verrucomicrobiota bacterium]